MKTGGGKYQGEKPSRECDTTRYGGTAIESRFDNGYEFLETSEAGRIPSDRTETRRTVGGGATLGNEAWCVTSKSQLFSQGDGLSGFGNPGNAVGLGCVTPKKALNNENEDTDFLGCLNCALIPFICIYLNK